MIYRLPFLKTPMKTVCALALALAPISAQAFTAPNGARVFPVNDAVFEVVAGSSTAGQDMWCAAARYAYRALNAPWEARIYIARGMTQSVTTNRRSAVHYTLDPAAAGVTPRDGGIALNQFNVGDNMTVSHANSYCSRRPNLF